MTSVSRSAQFAKIHKVLKKHYKPVAPPEDRPVLEHLLFACCLEDARYEAAEEAFAALDNTFYDWNEVRVTSISELGEVMAVLPDPRLAANRLKRVLHGIFEEMYDFNLEDKRKKNLGPTVKWLEKLDGSSKFIVGYVVQAALGGHSIPIDAGTMSVFRLLDLVTDKEAATGEVPGLERAVAKSKGAEFGSLIHQLAADYSANPFSPQVRDIILQIDSDAGSRFPQRRQAKAETAAAHESTEHAAKGQKAETAASPHAGPARGKKGDAAAAGKPHAPDAKSEAKSDGKKGGKKETHAATEHAATGHTVDEAHHAEKAAKAAKAETAAHKTEKQGKAAHAEKPAAGKPDSEKHPARHVEKHAAKGTEKAADKPVAHEKHSHEKHAHEKHDGKSGKSEKSGKHPAAGEPAKEPHAGEGMSKRKPR
jgi:endonuclease-3